MRGAHFEPAIHGSQVRIQPLAERGGIPNWQRQHDMAHAVTIAGRRPAEQEKEADVAAFICEKCGSIGQPTVLAPRSLVLEAGLYGLSLLLLHLAIVLPTLGMLGVIGLVLSLAYTIWHTYCSRAGCGVCGGDLIPADTPQGRAMIEGRGGEVIRDDMLEPPRPRVR